VNPSSSRSSKLISAAFVERAAIKLPSKKEESSSMGFNRFIDQGAEFLICEPLDAAFPPKKPFTRPHTWRAHDDAR
jgi:hypothetical protein